jgi:hypothetical protein
MILGIGIMTLVGGTNQEKKLPNGRPEIILDIWYMTR